MPRIAVLALLLAAVVAPTASAGVGREDVAEHLRALAAIAEQHGNTRSATTPGDTATAEYLAARMREAGYTVSFQTFSFAYFEERRAPVLGGLRHGRDFVTTRQSAAGEGRGRVRRISTGCRRSDFGRLRRGDLAAVRGGACSLERIAANAHRAGAAAMLLEDTRRPLAFALRPVLKVPVLQVARRPLRRLISSGRRVVVSVDAFRERRTTRNVLAERGTGRRVVMAGGHLDSVPEGPGINDNGSGLAALLEAAEELAADPPRGATVRFGFWGAEEWGLHGSDAYVERLPRAERRRIAAYLNLDMVGSPNAVPIVYGTRRMRRALHRAVGAASTTQLGASSDHAAFARAGIPVAGFYTGGLEIKSRRQARLFGGTAGRPMDPCYHRSCDGLAAVDTRWTARAARVTAKVLRGQARRRGAR